MPDAFAAFTKKMKADKLPQALIDLFHTYYDRLKKEESVLIAESDIISVCEDDVPHLEDLEDFSELGKSVLGHAVTIKLNGGLGTSMGMPFAKSLLKVKDGNSFLDVICMQAAESCSLVEEDHVSVAFMNSFSTQDDTLKALKQHMEGRCRPDCFLQHKFPKILQDGLSPASYPQDTEMEWNPPGHGDIYAALYLSGLLEKYLAEGKRWAFISNSDNLGAVMDLTILGYFVQTKAPMLMEVARRTPSDMKGGHPARLKKNAEFILREIAQCPEEDLEFFQDIDRHCLFNTNNIWVDLVALSQYIHRHGLPALPMILNPKHLNPRDASTPMVWQIETAMGAALSLFDGSQVLLTPRNRFIPVKKTNDLLLVRSDYYQMKNCRLVPNEDRKTDAVRISLDSTFYGKIDDMEARFPQGVPSLVNCTSLTVTGDVLFEGGVTVEGLAEVVNRSDVQAVVPQGTVLHGEMDVTPA